MPTVTFTVEGPGAGTGTLWFKPRTNFTTPDGDIVTPTDSRRDVPYTLNVQKSVVLPEGPWQVSGLATKTPLPFDVASAGGDLKDLIVFNVPSSAPATTLAQAVATWMDGNMIEFAPAFPAEQIIVIDPGTGNVTSVTTDAVATTYTYNPDGTVATDTRLGVTRTYGYDGNGNLTSITVED